MRYEEAEKKLMLMSLTVLGKGGGKVDAVRQPVSVSGDQFAKGNSPDGRSVGPEYDLHTKGALFKKAFPYYEGA